VQFSRLRLSGFKSFVDPIEMAIEPGITGVVGPNGCGKSNLVEAMRWVMGETSPKAMRGGGMSDVIFSGTERRPPRNLAEVTLTVDNRDRDAPSAFNDTDTLEISRRIERDSGSTYRVNGREVRAKDVQLLFADAATGAHSPALVGQGRVSGIITAKPQDRRAILEDAAGISGLHARRKEAEQRLRAAESNLERLQDVFAQIESQCANLKRQAREARRYRSLSADIRKSEAAILHSKWLAACEETTNLEAQLAEAETAVGEATRKTSALSGEQADLAAKLPERRNTEAEAAAAVQRLTAARDELDAEEQRRKDRVAKLEQQLGEIAGDRTREEESRKDAAEALERLRAERARLTEAQNGHREKEDDAKQALDTAQAAASEAEQAFDTLSQRLAEARGRKASLESDLTAIERRLDRLRLDREEAERSITELEGGDEAHSALAQAESEIAEAEQTLDSAGQTLETAEQETAQARRARDTARDAVSARSSELSALEAEIASLEKRLASGGDEGVAVAERVEVDPGWEAALGAALGEDLEASEDSDAAIRWTTLPPLSDPPALPGGVRALNAVVRAPGALARRLAMVGLVDSEDQGAALAEELAPGQRLVAASGALWRWDGLVADGEAPTAAALRLQQKNRLAALAEDREAARQALEAAEGEASAAESALGQTAERESECREASREAERTLRAARQRYAEAEAAANRAQSRLAGLKETIERLDREAADGGRQKTKIEQALAELPDLEELASELESQREEVAARRNSLAEARAAYDGLRREAEDRRQRLESVDTEMSAWQARLDRADKQLTELAERETAAQAEKDELEAAPEDVEAKRQALLGDLSAAESRRQDAADRLAEAESALAEKDKALKEAQEGLATAREERARLQSALESLKSRRDELAEDCAERFQCRPEALCEQMEIAGPEERPALEDLEQRLERLKAARERLGAVNLRAEDELAEAEEQREHLVSEREDLEGAIQRLRQAIGNLNREGRQRLLAAFEEVNRHFGELFATLFQGGEAHLELVESDDPLEAGLEIMASPPGKRLQALSLLSGGEQALTALALIFAVFMTNPGPICVLDEVDAPLDEANVERFCNLLDALMTRVSTRFLEVTMARMHRLFGVTMPEQGISQLVSVSLDGAAAMAAAE